LPVDTVDTSAITHASLLFTEIAERTLIAAGDITTTRRATLAERALEPIRADQISAFIDTTITVIIFTITDLFRLISTVTTAVTCPLIDRAVTVVIFTVTCLGDQPPLR
jgi:hypothetical protein